jgi:hypothetical protein
MPLPAPILALHACSLACAVAALDGAYGLFAPRGAARGPGLEAGEGAALAPLRALAGARLASHAAVFAVLSTAPAVGACMAAALGSAWLGAAAGRSISLLAARERRPADLLRTTGAAVLGVVLWAPLWLYLQTLRAMVRAHAGV